MAVVLVVAALRSPELRVSSAIAGSVAGMAGGGGVRLALARLRLHLRPGILLALIALAEFGAPWPVAGRLVALGLAALLAAGFVGHSLQHLRLARRAPAMLRARLLELALSVAAIALLASMAAAWARALLVPASRDAMDAVYREYAVLFLGVAGIRLVAGDFSSRRFLYRLDLQPAQTVAAGFAGAILVGTLLLSLPWSLVRLEDLSLLDALFTATSAVTVTGLVVHDPATFYTPFGQAVILALIQLGGLGTMVASASLVVLAGQRLRLRQTVALRDALDLETVGLVKGQIQAIVVLTAMTEVAGAVLLYLHWQGQPAVERPLFDALFHAVSAFCNAGFSSVPGGLLAFRDDAVTAVVMAGLIVAGGLGFPVLRGLRQAAGVFRARRRTALLPLHARLALLTTAVLLVGGALAALILEGGQALAGLPWPARPLQATFLSVTARTAGFSTIPVASLGAATLWLLMLLMFIGGSPGSTAGGIKTTTAATIVAAIVATIQGRPRVEVFRRTLPDEQVAKALALVGVSLGTVSAGVLFLLATQAGGALGLVFEAVSAFGTVGLSTGVTPTLDAGGKLAVMALMFIGRTGPLTLGFALALRSRRSRISYPSEKVMIG